MSLAHARTLLKLACWVTVLVGGVACAASHPTTAAPWRWLFALLQGSAFETTPMDTPDARVLSAITGGLMIGWGALMLRLTRRPDPPYGDLLFGLTLWFVCDSTGSWIAGVPGNIALNVGFYLLFALPLLRLRRAGD